MRLLRFSVRPKTPSGGARGTDRREYQRGEKREKEKWRRGRKERQVGSWQGERA